MKKIDKIMIFKVMSLLIGSSSIEKMSKLIILKENLHTSQTMATRLERTLINFHLKLESSKKRELRIWMKSKDLENLALIEKEKTQISSKESELLTMIWLRLRKEILN